jgi:hypothetical protein
VPSNTEIIRAVLEWLLEERQASRLSSTLRSAIAADLDKPLLALKRDQSDAVMAAIDSYVQSRVEIEGRGAVGAALKVKADQFGKDYDTLRQQYYRYKKRMAGLKDQARALGVDLTDPVMTRIRHARRPRKRSSVTKI